MSLIVTNLKFIWYEKFETKAEGADNLRSHLTITLIVKLIRGGGFRDHEWCFCLQAQYMSHCYISLVEVEVIGQSTQYIDKLESHVSGSLVTIGSELT